MVNRSPRIPHWIQDCVHQRFELTGIAYIVEKEQIQI
jgi:hypothetical protein